MTDAKKVLKVLNTAYDRTITVVLTVILLIVVYCMYDNYWVYSHTLNKDILKYKPTVQGYDPGESPITDDMVGWLTVDDTNIDYPVMQGTDNTVYLNRDPLGAYSLSGSIFLDSRNSSDFSDSYSIVYGHHMEYGKMFGALDDFLDPEYMRSHRTGTLIVGRDGQKSYKLEVFAAMKTDTNDKSVFDPKGAVDIGETVRSRAEVFLGEKDCRILALSTCSSAEMSERLLVFCYILE